MKYNINNVIKYNIKLTNFNYFDENLEPYRHNTTQEDTTLSTYKIHHDRLIKNPMTIENHEFCLKLIL